jgi:hypothetical protein
MPFATYVLLYRMPPLVTYRQPLDRSTIRSARRSVGCLRIRNCLGWKPDGALSDLVVIHPLDPEAVATARGASHDDFPAQACS